MDDGNQLNKLFLQKYIYYINVLCIYYIILQFKYETQRQSYALSDCTFYNAF